MPEETTAARQAKFEAVIYALQNDICRKKVRNFRSAGQLITIAV